MSEVLQRNKDKFLKEVLEFVNRVAPSLPEGYTYTVSCGVMSLSTPFRSTSLTVKVRKSVMPYNLFGYEGDFGLTIGKASELIFFRHWNVPEREVRHVAQDAFSNALDNKAFQDAKRIMGYAGN